MGSGERRKEGRKEETVPNLVRSHMMVAESELCVVDLLILPSYEIENAAAGKAFLLRRFFFLSA